MIVQNDYQYSDYKRLHFIYTTNLNVVLNPKPKVKVMYNLQHVG